MRNSKLNALNTFNDRLEQVIFEINLMVLSVENGSEEITEQCNMNSNYKTGEMEYVSPTTGEIVFKRILTAEERQLKIE